MSTEEERIRTYSDMLHAEYGPMMQRSFAKAQTMGLTMEAGATALAVELADGLVGIMASMVVTLRGYDPEVDHDRIAMTDVAAIHGMLYSVVEKMMAAKFPKQMAIIKGQLYKAMGGSELVGVAAERFKQGVITGDKA